MTTAPSAGKPLTVVKPGSAPAKFSTTAQKKPAATRTPRVHVVRSGETMSGSPSATSGQLAASRIPASSYIYVGQRIIPGPL